MASYSHGDNGYFVSGGLVIPFYLIVLSLVGGAVSLTRRIPEYQKVVDKLRPDAKPIPPAGSLAGTIAALKGVSAQDIEKTVSNSVPCSSLSAPWYFCAPAP